MTGARDIDEMYALRMSVHLEAFPRRLRAARLARGWSMEELAGECGLSRQHIHLLERGGKPNVAARTVQALAAGLETTVDWLLGLEGTDAPPPKRRRRRA